MKRMLLFYATLWLGIMGASAQRYHYDVNNDGEININDAVALVNKILGKDNPGEGAGGEAVDLGLPSGTLWSSCNVGAFNPEEYGNYYAWGETKTKDTYSTESYQYYQNGSCVNIGTDISGTKYDVAHHKWGGKWVVPTSDDFRELIDNCTSEWTMINGVNGCKYTSKINGKSIFMPAAGARMDDDLSFAGEYGVYWLSTQHPNYSDNAYGIIFISSGVTEANFSRYVGFPVRPVIKTIPASAIDLGLPSGTKWASCNVGATKPEEYGGYYSWGETEEKEVYDESTYKYYQNGEYVNLGSDISGTKYDVAHVKWGGNWCMPTLDDIDELLDNCTDEWTTLNGVYGRKFTSNINGNSIFLPAAGFRWGGDLLYAGEDGDYWSSTQNPDGSSGAYGLYFNSGYALWYGNFSRYYGQSVRPVVRN